MEYRGVFLLSPQPHLTSRTFQVNIGENKVTSEVTSCPNRIQEWVNGRLHNQENRIDFGFALQTKTLPSGNLKALICSFSRDNECLIVQLDRNSTAVLSAIREFMLNPDCRFCGAHMQEAMAVLSKRVRRLNNVEGQPAIVDLNVEAARSYQRHDLGRADLRALVTHVFNAYPLYPDAVYQKYDGVDQLEDGQVGTLTMDAFAAGRVHAQIILHDANGH